MSVESDARKWTHLKDSVSKKPQKTGKGNDI